VRVIRRDHEAQAGVRSHRARRFKVRCANRRSFVAFPAIESAISGITIPTRSPITSAPN
jgi:hypothetical protein